MTRADLTRRAFLGATSAAGLAACTSDLQVADAPREEPKGGIGGTGIVGTLTEFGSLLVNGRRVLINDATAISGPLGPLAEADLALGQALTIEADSETLIAARVFVADPVIGRVFALYPERRAMWVDGVEVTLEADAGPLPAIGDHVAVSGLWRDQSVIATRLSPAPANQSAMAGVFRREAGKLPRIGSARVILPGDIVEPADGAFVVVRGDYQSGGFFVEEMDIGRFVGAAGPLKALSVEGYLDPTPQAPFFEIAGLGHSFDERAQLSAVRDDRAIFEGVYTGDFAVSRAVILPDTQAARREALRDGSAEVLSTR